MTFDELMGLVSKKGCYLDRLGQVEDGKKWSVCVRKKGTTKMGYAANKDMGKAVKEALASMHDSLDPKGYKDAPRNPEAKKRKRVKIK